MNKPIRWTEEELAKLKSEAGKSQTWDELFSKFPNRTATSVKTKCEKNKIKIAGQRKGWTEEEIELLKEKYPSCRELRDIVQFFSNRTATSIKHKAERIGLKREIDYHFWTDENVEKLKKFYPNSTQEELEQMFPNMKYEQIVGKACRLKLKKTSEFRSEAQRGENNHFFGHKHTKKTKEHLKDVWNERKQNIDWVHCWTGRKHTEATKEKQSKYWFEHYKTHLGHFEGKQHSEESKQNMRKPHNMSEEGSQALRESVMTRPHFRKIPYELDDGVIYLDSSYEVLFVDGLIKHKFEWKRNTTESVTYLDDDNKEHHFYPDFVVWNNGIKQFVEIKGEHLLCDDFEINGTKCYTVRKCRSAVEEYGDNFVLLSFDGVVEFLENGSWTGHEIDLVSIFV